MFLTCQMLFCLLYVWLRQEFLCGNGRWGERASACFRYVAQYGNETNWAVKWEYPRIQRRLKRASEPQKARQYLPKMRYCLTPRRSIYLTFACVKILRAILQSTSRRLTCSPKRYFKDLPGLFLRFCFSQLSFRVLLSFCVCSWVALLGWHGCIVLFHTLSTSMKHLCAKR